MIRANLNPLYFGSSCRFAYEFLAISTRNMESQAYHPQNHSSRTKNHPSDGLDGKTGPSCWGRMTEGSPFSENHERDSTRRKVRPSYRRSYPRYLPPPHIFCEAVSATMRRHTNLQREIKRHPPHPLSANLYRICRNLSREMWHKIASVSHADLIRRHSEGGA